MDSRAESKREQLAYLVNFLVSPDEYQVILSKVAKAHSMSEKPTRADNLRRRLADLFIPVEYVQNQSSYLNDLYISIWRSSTRLYAGTYAALTLADIVPFLAKRIAEKSTKSAAGATARPHLLSKSRARSSSSAAMILVLYRLMYVFTTSLHTGIASIEARRFRKKHRRTTKILRSPYFASFTSGLMSGLFIYWQPAGKARSDIAFYSATVAAEQLFNFVTLKKQFAFMRRQVGAWILFPVSLAQLLYTFVYNPDCCPDGFKSIMLKLAPSYIPQRPPFYPKDLGWPSTEQTMDSLRRITTEKYPPFNSAILYPDSYALPSNFKVIDPIASQAHPGIKHLSCAILHPSEDSCWRNFATKSVIQFGKSAKVIGGIYTILAILSLKKYRLNPKQGFVETVKGFLRTNTFVTMTISTLWAGLCASQALLSDKRLPIYRIKIIGFVAGLWAFLDRVNGQAKFIPVARMGFESYWRTLVKKGKVRVVPHGDVLVFAGSLAVLMAIFDRAPQAIENSDYRKVLSFLSGQQPKISPGSSPQTPSVEKRPTLP